MEDRKGLSPICLSLNGVTPVSSFIFLPVQVNWYYKDQSKKEREREKARGRGTGEGEGQERELEGESPSHTQSSLSVTHNNMKPTGLVASVPTSNHLSMSWGLCFEVLERMGVQGQKPKCARSRSKSPTSVSHANASVDS